MVVFKRTCLTNCKIENNEQIVLCFFVNESETAFTKAICPYISYVNLNGLKFSTNAFLYPSRLEIF